MTILARKTLADPSASYWIKGAIKDMESRDVVDMLNDAELLVRLVQARLDETIELAKAIELAFDGAPRGNIFAKREQIQLENQG